MVAADYSVPDAADVDKAKYDAINDIDELSRQMTLAETDTERLWLARLMNSRLAYLLQLLQTLSLLLFVTERLQITNFVPFI